MENMVERTGHKGQHNTAHVMPVLRVQTHTEYVILLFHGTVVTQTSQCYVICTLSVLLCK